MQILQCFLIHVRRPAGQSSSLDSAASKKGAAVAAAAASAGKSAMAAAAAGGGTASSGGSGSGGSASGSGPGGGGGTGGSGKKGVAFRQASASGGFGGSVDSGRLRNLYFRAKSEVAGGKGLSEEVRMPHELCKFEFKSLPHFPYLNAGGGRKFFLSIGVG